MSPSLSEAAAEEQARGGVTRAIGSAALILMAGNLLGSLLGFVRSVAIAGAFGDKAQTDAFVAASVVPQMFYDLVVGAAISAALIPTFTEVMERRGEDDMWQLVGSVLTLLWTVLAVIVACLVVFSRPLVALLPFTYSAARGQSMVDLTASLVRPLVLSLFFLGTSAVLTAALYALRRFKAPAFAPSWYHVGIIGGALLGASRLGVMALPIGAVIGAALQTLTEFLAAARSRPHMRLGFHLTPELRRILRLYGPVAAGLIVSVVGQVIDLAFKVHQGASVLAAMQWATTLTQFPIGIAVAAMSFAVLPSISSDAAFNRVAEYKETIAQGMRLVLFLTIPAAAGYLALATPIASLLFRHGQYGPHGTAEIATALVGYAIQIPFVGVDQMLIFAFYARGNTKTPMLVGVFGVCTYVATAWLLAPRYHVLGLALANTLQNSLHALILLALLTASVGTLAGGETLRSVLRSIVAGVLMALAAAGTASLISGRTNSHALPAQMADALPPLLLGAGVYLLVSALLRSPELTLAWRIAARRPIENVRGS